MGALVLPGRIEKRLADMDCEKSRFGCSQAGVYKFSSPRKSYYLKIEQEPGELEIEYRNLTWLHGRISVPEVINWVSENGFNYLLLSEMGGEMVCGDYYLQNPLVAVSVLAKGLRALQSIPVANCPIYNNLDMKLRDAAENIKRGLVDMDDWDSSTSREIYHTPQALLDYLCANRPAEELAFTHGDYCFDNIFGENCEIKGFIDMGRAGVADLWQDVALGIRSLRHNFNTNEYDSLLLKELGIALNEEKLAYYILLDELF